MISKITICLFIASLLTSCTGNQRAKTFGGTTTVDVSAGNKVIGATWKENNLWYLTRPMRDGEKPEDVTLQESSDFGIVQGKVIFHETK